MTQETIAIFTDGACRGNPGVGAWGAIIRCGTHEKQIAGAEAHTTNNRMEMMAAIAALEALKRPSRVALTTDSNYLRQGMTQWLEGWKRRNWRNSQNKPVKNRDLWERLDALNRLHKVSWHWVKGHSGHPENELADQLANEAIDRFLVQGGAS
jgi:ribonuclease HI